MRPLHFRGLATRAFPTTRLAVPAAVAALVLVSFPSYAVSPGSNHPNAWDFTGNADGLSPRGDLLFDASGHAYGTTSSGGASNDGSVFEVTLPTGGKGLGTGVGLYDFTGGTDGSTPTAGLIADSSGNLYGTAALDGAGNAGTVFRIAPPGSGQTTWTETTLWGFGTGNDGRNPMGTLVADPAGNLYGTTDFGGTDGQGIVFELSPPAGGTGAWTETILWNFTSGSDGANPVAGLVLDATGALYGTSKAGGPAGVGTVFKLTPPSGGSGWTESTLWGFSGGTDGAAPTGTLLPDGSGGFYGTTQFGGGVNPNCNQARYPYYHAPNSESAYAANAAYVPTGGNECGVIFHLTPPTGGGTAWTEAIVWSFTAGTDGANPNASVIFGPGGTLFGNTSEYGDEYWGAMFELTPPAGQGGAWTVTPVVSFDGKGEGFYPRGTPVFGPSGLLYGTTSVGGDTWKHVTDYGYGTVFHSKP
jgi:uncharacterized repeat protein (TIGR03803 family)